MWSSVDVEMPRDETTRRWLSGSRLKSADTKKAMEALSRSRKDSNYAETSVDGVPKIILCSDNSVDGEQDRMGKSIRWKELDTTTGEYVKMKETTEGEKKKRKVKKKDTDWTEIDAESGETTSVEESLTTSSDGAKLKKPNGKQTNNSKMGTLLEAVKELKSMNFDNFDSRDEPVSAERDLSGSDGREDPLAKGSVYCVCNDKTDINTLLSDHEQLLARLNATEAVNKKRLKQLAKVKANVAATEAEKDQLEAQLSQMTSLLTKARTKNSLLKQIMELKKGATGKRRNNVSESFVMPAIGQYGQHY